MKVDRITIETVRFQTGVRDNVIILWTEDGRPHTLVDSDHNVAYPTQLASNETFEIIIGETNGS